jgi:hypothetical protein
MSTNTEAAKSAAKAVGITLVILVIAAFWFWPRERWENEWNGGDCLAWRVTDYGDLFSSVAGPYVVEDRWC